jgi:hypothetical protein
VKSMFETHPELEGRVNQTLEASGLGVRGEFVSLCRMIDLCRSMVLRVGVYVVIVFEGRVCIWLRSC